MKSFLRILLLLVVFSLSFMSMVPRDAPAAGYVQNKLRQRIKARIIKKLESQPAPEITASVNDKITHPGDYTFAIDHDGLRRYYMVHVPPGYAPSTPAPVLFALHGGLGNMAYMANDEYYGLITKSNKENFIVVFPNGYSKFRSGKLATWNAGTCCGQARDKNIDDVGFIKDIVGNLTRQMNINRNMIFATGMSNGGLMSHRLACEMADTFKAIAPVAGTDNTTECHTSRPVSVIMFHAKDDDHILFNGGAGKAAFKDSTKVAEFTSVPETISRWVKRDRCNPTPQRVLENPGAYCDLYSQCADNAHVELCVTNTGGHSWPGGFKRPRGGELTSKAISADDLMWDFFKNQQ